MLCNADWTRFELYAPLVRTLHHIGRLKELRSTVLADGRHRLIHSKGSKFLLPNLNHIHWDIYTEEDVRGFCAFLSDSLVSVYVYIHPSLKITFPHPAEFLHLVEELVQVCASVTHLTVISDTPLLHPDFAEHMLQLLASQPHLRTISVNRNFFLAAGARLPHLPYLQSLTLHGYTRPIYVDVEKISFASYQTSVPALQRIEGYLEDGPNQFWHKFLHAMGHNINEIVLDASWNSIEISELGALFAAIGRCCPALRCFRVMRMMVRGHDETARFANLLGPLLACPGITVLEVSSDISSTLDDDDLSHMGTTWKALEILRIRSTQGHILSRPTVSLDAVRSLCRHCHNLRELALGIDISKSTMLHTSPSLISLQRLELHNSWIEDRWEAALSLATLCPASGIIPGETGWAQGRDVKRFVEIIQSGGGGGEERRF
jgi:hypothetical protein